MEWLKSSFSFYFVSKTEGSSSLPTHNQRSPTRSSSSIFQEQDMGKTILILAFSATIALVVLLFNLRSSVPQVDPPLSLRFLGMAILIAFSASFIAISLRRSFPRAATILEHIGIVSTVAAFFMLMSFLLPSNFKWLVLAACVVSLLGYVVPHVEGFSVSTDAGVGG
ncbi:hypothetical protein MRB53_012618 [Persea americana]|uniref:Uncharacterized protein n=1 Tax=Persea americana TaxID=3435 RepID=A0ACC2LXT5_PERAE|nr:hypothetical protein MRB53_012618 [Persea americana]